MSGEIWKPIPDFPGYEVSSKGRVRSYREQAGFGKWKIANTPQRILSPGGKRYRKIILCRDGEKFVLGIANLVMLAFVGSCPDGMEVCHNDGDSHNDAIENLRYDTHQKNMYDDLRHGKRGKFAEKEVSEIRKKYNEGASQSDLAARFEVTTDTIGDICRGDTYSIFDGPITKNRHIKLSRRDAEEIRMLRNDGLLLQEIADMYDVCKSHVSLICSGKRWNVLSDDTVETGALFLGEQK